MLVYLYNKIEGRCIINRWQLRYIIFIYINICIKNVIKIFNNEFSQ